MPTVQEGRNQLAAALGRECDEAKRDLLASMQKAKDGLADADQRIADGFLVQSSVTGGAFIVPDGHDDVNTLGTKWMDAERRRVRLLDLYDRVNGTKEEA